MHIGNRGDLVVEIRRAQLEQPVRVGLLQCGLLLGEGPDVLQEVDLLGVLGLELGQLVLVQVDHVLRVGALAGRRGGRHLGMNLSARSLSRFPKRVFSRGEHVTSVLNGLFLHYA